MVRAEWLSEDHIRFTYDDVYDKYDEGHIIAIPDEPSLHR